MAKRVQHHWNQVMDVRKLSFLACFVLLSGCGGDRSVLSDGSPSLPPVANNSPVVLTTIPEVLLTEVLFTRSILRIAPSSSEAKFFYQGNSSSINFANSAILAARPRKVNGILYVLLSVVDRTTEQCTIYRVHDTDGDWLPDASTVTSLADSGTRKSYVTSISAGRDGTLYLLDRRCQDVFVFEDTDQDGWEDSWDSSPIVRSQDFAYLLDARAVYGGDGSVPTVQVFQIESPNEVSFHAPVTFREYADTDLDGLADQETIHDQSDAPPRLGIPPQAGVLSLRVNYTFGGGATGDVVEAWSLDAQGQEDTLLGSVTMPASLKGTISLSSSLTKGDRIALKKSGASNRSVRIVWPEGPTILAVSPSQVEEGVAETLVIAGHGFSADSRVWMRDPDDEQVMLSTTYVNSTTLQASIPASTLVAGSRCYLSVFDQNAAGEFTVAGANFFHLQVCSAE